jgi:hypothetical protein
MLPSSLLAPVLQSLPGIDGTGVDVTVGLGGSAVGAALTTLLVGAVLVALAPAYTERMLGVVREDALGAFLYGIVGLVSVVLLTVLLVVTVVGILVAIPFVLLSVLVWAVGAAVALLAIGDRLVGHENGWLKPLAVGAFVNGGLALTGIGGLLSFCIGAAGFGAVLRDRFG